MGKKVLLLHGLGSEPNPNRLRMLNKLGYEVIQELHDYKTEWDVDKGESFFKKQLEITKDVDLIIGVSFGGYVAYHLSKATGKSVILINPALDRSKTKTEIKNYNINYSITNSKVELFQGEKDKSVPPEYALDFLGDNKIKYTHKSIKRMEHRVPDDFFKKIIKQSKLI